MSNEDRISVIRSKLTAACEAAVAGGKRIIAGSFRSISGMECCPMAAFDEDASISVLAMKLGTDTEEEVWAFVWAFDGMETSYSGRLHPDFHALGQEFRAKYIGGGK